MYPSGNYKYEEFSPKPWKLFIVNYQEMTILKWIRFSLASIYGSKIIYMKDLYNNYLGYCLLEKKSWRYPFIESTDLVISPYVVRPDLRGQGIGTKMLLDISETYSTNSTSLYALVKQDNLSSIKAMKKAKFKDIGFANIIGLFRKYYPSSSNKSEYIIFKK